MSVFEILNFSIFIFEVFPILGYDVDADCQSLINQDSQKNDAKNSI